MESLPLTGKVAIVTGSARENGIGAGIAMALAKDGADVVIHHVSDSSTTRAQEMAKKIQVLGRNSGVVKGDVTSPEGAKKIMTDTLAVLRVEKIDILVNNVGGAQKIPMYLMGSTAEELKADFGLNAFSVVFCIQAVVPHMPPGGRIINTGSVASRLLIPGYGSYGAAKAALNHFTAALAEELGKSKGITVNTVAPGPVMTDLLKASGLTLEELEVELKPFVDKTKAADRVGTPEDIADVVAFLASEKSRWITGQYIDTSGGITSAV